MLEFVSPSPATETADERPPLSALYRAAGNPVLQRYYKGGVATNIRLADVLHPLNCGTRAKQMKAHCKHLRPEVVDVAQAFRDCNDKPLHDYLQAQPQRHDLRILLDQHITPDIIPYMQDVFGLTTHVRQEALHNCSDKALFEHAYQNGVDIIVTQDKSMFHARTDLSAIAVSAHENGVASVINVRNQKKSNQPLQAPLILQIGNDTNTGPEIRALFESSYHRIVDEADRRSVPLIRLLPDRVVTHEQIRAETKSPELLAIEKRLRAMGYAPGETA